MYSLYVKIDEKWQEYASFKGRFGDYREQVREAVTRKMQDGKMEVQNAACIMKSFVLEKKYFKSGEGKPILRALRWFDEVGISNDVCESLDEALDEGIDEFAVVKAGDELSAYTCGLLTIGI